MLLYSYYDSDTGIRITESIEYKEEEIEKSRKKFKELKDEGIIISGNFEDSKWLLTNEVHTTTSTLRDIFSILILMVLNIIFHY